MSDIIPKLGWILFLLMIALVGIVAYVYVTITEAIRNMLKPVREDSFQ